MVVQRLIQDWSKDGSDALEYGRKRFPDDATLLDAYLWACHPAATHRDKTLISVEILNE